MEQINCDVAIAGGGLAGLASALHLAESGRSVCLIEAGSRYGGSVFSFKSKAGICDNSFHLMLCNFENLLALIKKAGSARHLLSMDAGYSILKGGSFKELDFNSSFSGMPGLALALASSSFWAWKTKLQFAALFLAIKNNKPDNASLAADWLLRLKPQSSECQEFWQEWCISVFNARLADVSASLFRQTILLMFAVKRRNYPLRTEGSLDELLISPLGKLLDEAAVTTYLKEPLRSARLSNNDSRVQSWHSPSYEIFAEDFIYAAPPDKLSQIPGMSGLLEDFPARELGNEIVNVVVDLKESVSLNPKAMHGFFGEVFQWVFPISRKRIIFVGSAISNNNKPSSDSLLAVVDELLEKLGMGSVKEKYIIRQAKATWLQSADFERARPGNRSKIDNLYWVGAWTNTGLPLTMESAAKSAACIKAIFAKDI
jgi:hydroxysqualene dehydroxylase